MRVNLEKHWTASSPSSGGKYGLSTISILSKLAKKIVCHTATSVPSERIFSTAGNVVS